MSSYILGLRDSPSLLLRNLFYVYFSGIESFLSNYTDLIKAFVISQASLIKD